MRAKTAEPAPLTASRLYEEAHDASLARATVIAIAFALIGFLIWASVAPVYEIISGSGTIQPDGFSKRIEHPEGGIVEEILAREGDIVQEGDVLLRLNDSDLRAELRKIEARNSIISQNIARYNALLTLDLGDVETALSGPLFEDADPSFLEEIRYRLAQLDVVRANAAVITAQIIALETRHDKMLEEIAILTAQAARFDAMRADRIIPLSQLEEVQRAIVRLESDLGALKGEIAVQRATIQQTDAQAEEQIAAYRREAALRLDEQGAELLANQQSTDQIEDRIARAVLRAPASGTVGALSVNSPGEVVAAGEVITEIVPDDVRAIAAIEIPADRIGGIAAGRKASLKILTYDYTRFGDVTAVVDRISPSSTQNEQGQSMFHVTLTLDSEVVGGGFQDAASRQISPGMTVIADIKSDRRTVLSFILKSVRVLTDRAFTEA